MKLNLSKVVCLLCLVCAAVIASPAQSFYSLYSFCSQPNCADGYQPYAGLVQGSDGNLYGTTYYGGANGVGTVFQFTYSDTLTPLYSFCSQSECTDGDEPYAGLVQGTDSNFYGTTSGGGDYGYGTVFKMTPGGKPRKLYSFAGTDGAYPYAGLVQGTDGNFYGTTNAGGANNNQGTVFKITPAGVLTPLASFNGANGAFPLAGLVQGKDGNFYGTTEFGGANGDGTVFKISPQSPYTLTVLYSFCSQRNCTDGYEPYAGLVQGTDGNFYGTTYTGGAANRGTAFKITPGGTWTLLHSFNGADGANPEAGLVLATDNNFYGTTSSGGDNDEGTLFQMTPSGIVKPQHSFSGTDGSHPYAGLVQANTGNFYGTTYDGGANNRGTVFTLSGPPPNPVQFVAVTPCRLVDTRKQSGGSGPIQGGTYQTFNLPQIAPVQGCADLSTAAAYSLNVAVVPQGPLGYLTVWPTGQSQPVVATLNSVDGRVKANAAIVPGGKNGAINVFVSNTTDVVLDIDGYFTTPSGSTLAFYPLAPCRVADTRYNNYPQGLGQPHLSGGVARDFPVLNASKCNIPNTAAAYSMNFTVVPYPALGYPLGYLELWPTGNMPQNPVSTLNNLTGTVVANAAIVPAGSNGEITAFASNDTNLVIDINGYFAAPSQGGLSLYPVPPCRVLDTRNGNGAFSGELTVDVVDSICGPPSTAQAYVFNASVVPSVPLGYLTLWPDGGQQPSVSTLNALDGQVTSNMAVVPTNNGKIDADPSNLTQLILDISSYFAP